MITATLGALILAFYVLKLLKWSSVSGESDEREAIQDSFKDKFGQSLKGITDLKTQQNKLLEIYLKAKSNQEDLGKLRDPIDRGWTEDQGNFQGNTWAINRRRVTGISISRPLKSNLISWMQISPGSVAK